MSSARTLIALLALISTLASVTGVASAEIEETREPPLNLTLTVDGDTFRVQPGEDLKASIDGKQTKISIALDEERELRLKHLRFRYPSYFKFDVGFGQENASPVRWRLKGHDVDVTVFRTSADSLRKLNGPDDLSAWVSKLGGNKVVAEDSIRLEVGQLSLDGVRYNMPFQFRDETVNLRFDAFEIPGDFGDQRYFLFLTGWDGENPVEESLTRYLLETSFEVTAGADGKSK